ncbi:MAG: AMP phosphorylase [Candidatus Nanohaloarchaeota archaeon]|nr:AMP phosphorylase [Candidatus Nanohaloarchaeota archaeon]
MVLKLKVKNLPIYGAENHAFLHWKDGRKLNLLGGERIKVSTRFKSKTYIVKIDKEGNLVKEGEIVLSQTSASTKTYFKDGCIVQVKPVESPKSKHIIKKKIEGKELSSAEIKQLVEDIYYDRLDKIELAGFITAVYIQGYSIRETTALTKEMYKYGDRITWPFHWKIMDKHSIGGVPGNRTTPLVVSIVASTGLKIPKTSSRSITSPAGTADTIEVVAPVEFSANEIKRIVKKTNGCLVWGGALDLAPVDDKLIRVEHPLSLDPEGQVIASILSKKKSVGSKYVLIDIPYGEGSKVETLQEAEMMAEKFKIVGAKVDMVVESVITKGDEPIGRGIGPVLEMIDIIAVLHNRGPSDLKTKALELAGQILQMGGKGDIETAKQILQQGKAYKKFKEIIEAQGGSLHKAFTDMLGTATYEVKADQKGYITHISNKLIAEIAKRAGAPSFKGAGVYLYKKKGEAVKKGEVLFKIYAQNEKKLDYALEVLKKENPYRITQKQAYIVEKVF